MVLRTSPTRVYEWWLRRQLMELPGHVAVIMDGNRRWARQLGFASASDGHEHGARHLEQLLAWCDELTVPEVTVWVASADNIRSRDPAEVSFLMRLVETTIAGQLVRNARWRVHVIGQLDLLPTSTVLALKRATEETRNLLGVGDLTIAIGYSGREEIVDAVRSVLEEATQVGESAETLAARLVEADIARHLTTGARAPDLIIRTSGEQRMSDFLLWQSVGSELFFVDAYWPAFRRVDLLRVIRDYARRRRVA